jgi:hypothetical protein
MMAIAGALLAAGSVAAIAHGDEEPPLPGEGTEQVTTIEGDALGALGVLREERAASDALPEGVVAPLAENARFGMNPALSRLAIGQAMNSVYVIPANGHVCVGLTVGEGIGMTCTPTADLADAKASPVAGTVDGGAIAIFGLVPDGVESVTVDAGASGASEVETTNNAYYTVVEAGTVLRSVSYTGPDGQVDWPIHSPETVFVDP